MFNAFSAPVLVRLAAFPLSPLAVVGARDAPFISGPAAFVLGFRAECAAHQSFRDLSQCCPKSGLQQVSLTRFNSQMRLEKICLPISSSPLNLVNAFIAAKANGFKS